MTNRLLIVDDEAAIGFALSEYFGCSGWEVDRVASLDEAKAQARAKHYTAAIIDLCLSGGEGTEGLEVFDELHRQHPETLCILLTAYGSPWATTEARRRGAGADRGQARKAGRATAGITAAARHRRVVKPAFEDHHIAGARFIVFDQRSAPSTRPFRGSYLPLSRSRLSDAINTTGRSAWRRSVPP